MDVTEQTVQTLDVGSILVADAASTDLDQLCMDLLQRDSASRPTGRDVMTRLGIDPESSGPMVMPPHPSESAIFVGREAELATMRAAFESTLRGAASILYVYGESGVGKSALVSHFTSALADEQDDLVVLAGRCYERESVPYKGFDGVIDELTRFLRHLDDEDLSAVLPDDAGLLPRLFPSLVMST